MGSGRGEGGSGIGKGQGRSQGGFGGSRTPLSAKTIYVNLYVYM